MSGVCPLGTNLRLDQLVPVPVPVPVPVQPVDACQVHLAVQPYPLFTLLGSTSAAHLEGSEMMILSTPDAPQTPTFGRALASSTDLSL